MTSMNDVDEDFEDLADDELEVEDSEELGEDEEIEDLDDDDLDDLDEDDEMKAVDEALSQKEQNARSLAIRRAIEQRMEEKKLHDELDYLDD
jgi:chromatin segregation and condensation protein Rec8/ScpA/Scc1 (kleisin family)